MLNYTAGQKQLCDYKINTRLILLLALLYYISSISNVIFIANISRQIEGTLKSNTFLIFVEISRFSIVQPDSV